MQRPRVTVLITGAGTVTCQSVIKGLRAQHEFETTVVTADMSDANAGRWMSDRFEVVPAAADDQFVSTLLSICQRHQVDLLVPIVDYEFGKISRAKQQFEDQGTCVAISDPAAIETCNDKWLTYQFLSQLEIDTPRSWLPEDFRRPASFPLFVKPRLMGRASIDAYRVDTAAQLDQLLDTIDQPLIQTFGRGQEYTVDLLCDFQGRVVNGVVRERIETKSGVSSKGRTVANSELLQQAARIAEALPIVGPVNMQCFVDGETISFFDLNPRYSGALVLSIAAGFNSPLALLQLAQGIRPAYQLGDYQAGVQMFRYWEEMFLDSQNQPLSVADSVMKCSALPGVSQPAAGPTSEVPPSCSYS